MSKLGKKIIEALKEGLRDIEAGTSKVRVVSGSGNVYADMGLPDSVELMEKSRLAVRIMKAIRDGRMEHMKAKDRMGATPAEFLAIHAGKLDEFTAQRLRGMLESLLRTEGE